MVVKVIVLGSMLNEHRGTQYVELSDESTLLNLLKEVGLKANSPFSYAVNGKIATVEKVLSHNDAVVIIPHISGG